MLATQMRISLHLMNKPYSDLMKTKKLVIQLRLHLHISKQNHLTTNQWYIPIVWSLSHKVKN